MGTILEQCSLIAVGLAQSRPVSPSCAYPAHLFLRSQPPHGFTHLPKMLPPAFAPSLSLQAAASSPGVSSFVCGGPAPAPRARAPAAAAAPHMAAPAPDAPKIKVGVLGCTGSVGQRFMTLLEGHPWFEVAALGASSRSAGKAYADAVQWKQATPVPADMRAIVVEECRAGEGNFRDCKIVFSGMDNKVAGPVEEEFAAAGVAVFSNAMCHRMDEDVPILIPPVNGEGHLVSIDAQREKRGYGEGFIVTNANCSTTAMSIGLKPLVEAFGVETIVVATMQAISGAGYPGLSGMDILDNVVPLIGGEEPKMETESLKIFGDFANGAFVDADFNVSAMCNRVNVLDGHTEVVSLKFKNPASPEEAIAAIRNYPSVTKKLGLPSAPENDVVYTDEKDRPQPRMDRNVGNGFTVTVGRVRPCNVFDLRLVLFGHNTVVGAAGGSILNAELCCVKDYVK